MAEFKNPTYKFKFANPVLFKRVYNFKIDNSFSNEYWSPSDSDEKEVAKAFAKCYERCGSSSLNQRQKNATTAYNYFTN